MKWKKVAISIFSLAMVGVTAEAALIDGIKETVEEDNIKNISVYGQLPENKIKNPMKNQVTLEVLYPGMSEESFLENLKMRS